MKLKVFTLMLALFAVTLISPPAHSQTPAPDTGTVAVKVVQTPATPSSDVKADSVVLQTNNGPQSVPTSTVTAPSNVTFLGVKVPTWLMTLITVLITVLPTVQTLLKLIPSATPIGGVLGTILNALTFFIKNKQDSGTTTSTSTTS